ncbi:MAG: 2-succinyl-5-enolpyruvyl-6-hydroxy-3-cyclohexene-1-carboxylic-acid synthase [Candidatus Marinimicrobia bacterium]|nr:2-succinyl-5-enolpyruvyl-6-hydroxy-3-cyclohexene-1-carboxylic-acid synthase [Candidatus Neomarinimicrobiota bacterium]
MKLETGKTNLLWARFTANMLAHSGIRHVCLSPGSRNTPLTIAFSENSSFTCTSHFDERSAGYFALGVAKASEQPVVLCCTSGTAAANYLPAVVEANYSRVPIIVITADRPERLVGSGANQTIHQKNLYGVHVRYFRDVGEPSDRTLDLNQFLVSALSMAMGINGKGEYMNPPGPVHLNFPFDEPLHPLTRNNEDSASLEPPKLTVPPVTSIDTLPDADLLSNYERPLIVCGRLPDASDRDVIYQLSDHLNAPVFADIASQLRFGKVHSNVVCHYDLFLKVKELEPDLVIRFGAKPTSKLLCQKLDEWKDRSILIDPVGRYNDDCPKVIPCQISTFVRSVINSSHESQSTGDWLQHIRNLENSTGVTIRSFMDLESIFEASIVNACIKNLISGDHLFLGNSMPIRDADAFCAGSENDVHVHVNRGASGIDGCTSTAVGIGFNHVQLGKSSSISRTFLISGDVSFLYDVNALHTARQYGVNITIIVINNGGGGIFSFLPIAHYDAKQFDKFWTTPHKVSIEKIADSYDCAYFSAESFLEIANSISESRHVSGPAIIEVHTNISENVDRHGKALAAIHSALS